MPTILLIRHGQASFGGEDYDRLSQRGREQAEVLAAALGRRGLELRRLAGGSGRRHRETAAALGEGLGLEPAIDARWDEYDINQVLTHHSGTAARVDRQDGGGKTSAAEFRRALIGALDSWVAAGADSPCTPTFPEYAARGAAALEDLAGQLGSGETGIAVSSAGVVAAITASLIGLPPERFSELSRVAVNTAVTKIAIGPSGRSLVSFNDHSHLEEADRSLVTYQ